MKLSVIVNSTPERQPLLNYCLQMLTRQTFSDFEVIVVCDGITQPPNYPILNLRWDSRTQDGSVARSRNRGAALALSEKLVFIDGDILLNPRALEFYNQQLGPTHALFGYVGQMPHIHAPSLWFPDLKVKAFDLRFFFEHPQHIWTPQGVWENPQLFTWSGNFGISRSVFEATKGFNENFQAGECEDIEFGSRLLAQGTPIDFTLDTWAEHGAHPVNQRPLYQPQTDAPPRSPRLHYEAATDDLILATFTHYLPLAELDLEKGDPAMVGFYGYILEKQDRHAEAREIYAQLFSKLPPVEQGYVLNQTFAKTEQVPFLISLVERYVLQPELPLEQKSMVFYTLGHLFHNTGDLKAARAALEQSLRLDQTFKASWFKLGAVVQELGEFERAEYYYQQALNLPHQGSLDRECQVNLGILYLAHEQFEKGFQYWAKKWPAFSWPNESLAGKQIFIPYEYGFGDNLLFLRFLQAPELQDAEITVAAPAALLPLLKKQDFIHRVQPLEVPGPENALRLPLFALPAYLKDKNPPPPPYLDIPKGIVPGSQTGALQVGICWRAQHKLESSGHYQRLQAQKSCPFAWAQQLIQNHPQYQWWGFQKEPFPHDPTLAMLNLSEQMQDFLCTAQLLQYMDLLITVDTAIAHLAGAMNIPTVLLLSTPSYWIWPPTGNTVSWYPSFQVIRQTSPGDWDAVIPLLTLALKDFEQQKNADS